MAWKGMNVVMVMMGVMELMVMMGVKVLMERGR
jgi:hypothetical protein